MAKKPSVALSMRDRLSHLSIQEAGKLLGIGGSKLLQQGGAIELDSDDGVRVDEVEGSIEWRDGRQRCWAKIHFDPAVRGKLRTQCSKCRVPCIHVAALLSMVLEQKTALGLAAPPPDPARPTDETVLVERALAERAKRAKTERMNITSSEPRVPWTDYVVTSASSGKTYRVALRGESRGESYCSCPDFRTNTLGTCKHIMKVLTRVQALPKEVLKKRYRRTRVTIHLRYEEQPSLAIAMPSSPSAAARAIVEPLLAGRIEVSVLLRYLQQLEAGGHAFFVTPDAEEYIERTLLAERVQKLVAEIRKRPERHPLRTDLLKEPLLPYQLDGIAFAVGAGRAILADEMGLGKTIQGVGVAELLAREVGIRRVLIVCPASLKSQWCAEIQRFSGRDVGLITGLASERARAYAGGPFFTICNYEQVLKDILHVEKTPWDLIVLDEGQRIKNWEAKTSRVLKGLRSRFALVLTGTPLENRLEDLHSVVAFVDPHRLGPAFKFLHRHQRRDEAGKLEGFRNLDQLRERLRPVLLRRTRESVRLELPPRTVEIVRIAPSDEQKELHDAHMRTVAQIVRKSFLTEMDLMRLRMALLMCRMAANGTFLVDKQPPGFSTKLERLEEIFAAIAVEPDRKALLFSEWTTMLDLIEPALAKQGLGYVRLDGSVPQKERQRLVSQFQSDPKARLFLTTNAGSTGLNLQAANTIINVDLPWNPAQLEQRIARAHRMGQRRPVSVFVLVTEQTLEENLLTTLSSKRELALAALDPASDVTDVDVRSQADDIKSKLEVLLGAKPDAPVDETAKARALAAVSSDRLALAGSQLLKAAFELLGELSLAPSLFAQPSGRSHPRIPSGVTEHLREALDVQVSADERGRQRLAFTLPPRDSLAALLRGVAEALVSGSPPPLG